jgi:hypothetical protein
VFSPRTDRCSAAPRLCASERKKCGTSSLGSAPTCSRPKLSFEHEIRAARQVDRDLRFALIHRQQKAVAADAGLVAERLAQRLADGQRAILDRVVLVDVQVAAAAQLQRKAAVPGELLEHVIEEADAGGDAAGGAAVEFELQLDVGFARLAVQLRAAREQRARDAGQLSSARCRHRR